MIKKYILLLCIITVCIAGCGSKTGNNNLSLEAESFEELEVEEDLAIPYSITITDMESDLYREFLRDENEEFVEKLYALILHDNQKTKEKITSNSYFVEISDTNTEVSETYYFDKGKQEKTQIFGNIFKATNTRIIIRKADSEDEKIVSQNPDDYYDILKIHNYLSQTNLDKNDNSSTKEKMVLEVVTAGEEAIYYVSADYPRLYSLLKEYFDDFLIPLV